MSKMALAPGCAREYETIYILRPNVDRESADNVATRVTEAIGGHDGILTGVELWGRRRLSYPIQRHHLGVYVYVKYLGVGKTVNELERQLRLVDNVIRYQTIQLRDNLLRRQTGFREDVNLGDLAVWGYHDPGGQYALQARDQYLGAAYAPGIRLFTPTLIGFGDRPHG